ncbi:hypothetical protein Vadar_031017 [Vaccinium darrowii]|uniref:Uncharacterized protein n=1 Tax=Vaccinium darrowii TaxID=229202 RepID=A0ACB7X5J3_9ERIC|nr:hypothetical protein Vadar_031017 [Vaccinium darrowii]
MYSTNYLSILLVTILILDFANVCFCRIPIIGGKDLDLHRLFMEVTSRGGIKKRGLDGEVIPTEELSSIQYHLLLDGF